MWIFFDRVLLGSSVLELTKETRLSNSQPSILLFLLPQCRITGMCYDIRFYDMFLLNSVSQVLKGAGSTM